MLHFFKSRQYKRAWEIVNSTGLDDDDFNYFLIDQIVQTFINYSNMVPSLLEVIQKCKLTPFKSIKIVLVLYQYVHTAKQKSSFELIFSFLKDLYLKVQKLLKSSKNQNVKIVVPVKQSKNLDSSKEMIRQGEYQCQNFSEIILAKIVLPLISILQKMIFSYEQFYPKDKKMKDRDEICWIQLNLLRKISHLGIYIQDLGRYFLKSSSPFVIQMMRIISYDINLLYKTIVDFTDNSLVRLQEIIEKDQLHTKEEVNRHNIQQLLIFIEELQFLNEDLRLLYCGKYFAYQLIYYKIYCPSLFRANEYLIEQLYSLTRKGIQKKSKINDKSTTSMVQKKGYHFSIQQKGQNI